MVGALSRLDTLKRADFVQWLSPSSRWWVTVPVALMGLIQAVSGVPHPDVYVTEPAAAALGAPLSQMFGMSESSFESLTRKVLNGLHLPVFAVLTWLWCWALGPWSGNRRIRLGAAVAICVGFAILNEVSQLAVPHRIAAVHDAVVNIAGVGIGLLAFLGTEHATGGPR